MKKKPLPYINSRAKTLLDFSGEKSLYKVVSRDLGSSFGRLPQPFMISVILLLVVQFGRNSTGMGDVVVHVRWWVCRTAVIKTGEN